MERKNTFDSKILSSCNINFLFGAGVNGKAFPQLSSFEESTSLLRDFLGREVVNFESDINTLTSGYQTKVRKKFINEYKKFYKTINRDHNDIKDIEKLMLSTNKLILNSENRTITTKQVNIYTLNYDDIVEKVLENIGVLNNMISSSNIDNHDKFFNMVGYDYGLKRHIPTFLVSKIHGDISSPILPGNSKYDEVLAANKFDILFKMKSQLSRMNSVLIVIGYSGKDEHINKILKDCVTSGLTIYWFKYSSTDFIPESISSHVISFEQEDQDNKQNSTLMCSKMMENLWDTKSEE